MPTSGKRSTRSSGRLRRPKSSAWIKVSARLINRKCEEPASSCVGGSTALVDQHIRAATAWSVLTCMSRRRQDKAMGAAMVSFFCCVMAAAFVVRRLGRLKNVSNRPCSRCRSRGERSAQWNHRHRNSPPCPASCSSAWQILNPFRRLWPATWPTRRRRMPS